MATARVVSAPKVNKGSASIVFFYMGDSKFITLFQETTKLKKAMQGYNKVILLKQDSISGFFDLSDADEKIADKIVSPTKTNFFKYIVDLSKDGYYIDIWIWSHGTKEDFKCYSGDCKITNNDIENELAPSKTGLTCIPIRMVYQINCYGETLNNNWTNVGAKVSIGTKYVNFYPTQFGKFADEWNKNNVKIKDALLKSNTSTSRTLVQTYLATIHAPTHNKDWGNCPILKTILGDHSCAKDYFTTMWMNNSDWQSGKNGKDNMSYSSTWITAGSSSIKKSDKPSWS